MWPSTSELCEPAGISLMGRQFSCVQHSSSKAFISWCYHWTFKIIHGKKFTVPSTKNSLGDGLPFVV